LFSLPKPQQSAVLLPRSDLGCHIDGFIATQAQTVLVAANFDTPITGKAADLVEAARTAFNAAIRLIKPGAV
jgi:methionine aminopeptidase